MITLLTYAFITGLIMIVVLADVGGRKWTLMGDRS